MQGVLSKLQKIMLISFALSIVVTLILQYVVSTQIRQLKFTTTITISDEIRFSSPFKALVERSYFDSVGDVYVYMHSPYAYYWNTFEVWMSLDNSSWENVPFLEIPTADMSKMAYLGRISLYDPQMIIYVKYYIPPQTIFLPSNVTKEEASNIVVNVWIKRRAIPADIVQWISVFFGVFTVIGFILDRFLRKNSDKKSHTITRRKRKNIKRINSNVHHEHISVQSSLKHTS